MSVRSPIPRLHAAVHQTLAAEGGGPHDPTMEMRLSRLEDEFRTLRVDLGAMRGDTAYIRGRLEALPTTWQMIGTILAANIGLAGVLFAAARLFGHS